MVEHAEGPGCATRGVCFQTRRARCAGLLRNRVLATDESRGSRAPAALQVHASHRGPVTVRSNGQGVIVEPSGGGLVNMLRPALGSADTSWVVAAVSASETAAELEVHIPEYRNVRLVPVRPDIHEMYYDQFSNRVL